MRLMHKISIPLFSDQWAKPIIARLFWCSQAIFVYYVIGKSNLFGFGYKIHWKPLRMKAIYRYFM